MKFLRLAWESEWFLLTWTCISLVAKFHFPQSSPVRGAAAAIEETKVWPMFRVSVPWWD